MWWEVSVSHERGTSHKTLVLYFFCLFVRCCQKAISCCAKGDFWCLLPNATHQRFSLGRTGHILDITHTHTRETLQRPPRLPLKQQKAAWTITFNRLPRGQLRCDGTRRNPTRFWPSTSRRARSTQIDKFTRNAGGQTIKSKHSVFGTTAIYPVYIIIMSSLVHVPVWQILANSNGFPSSQQKQHYSCKGCLHRTNAIQILTDCFLHTYELTNHRCPPAVTKPDNATPEEKGLHIIYK